MIVLLIIAPIVTLCILIIPWIIKVKKKSEVKAKVSSYLYQKETFTPHEFLNTCEKMKRYKMYSVNIDRVGCYVIKNTSKNLCYVGQSIDVFRRVGEHLRGKGNGDVYADYKYGDNFIIYIVKCQRHELNLIEKNLIKEFDCVKHGYNKNAGIGSYY